MDKKNIYVSLVNSLIGIGLSLLLNGNLMIVSLLVLVAITAAWIERKFLFERVFLGSPKLALVGSLIGVGLCAWFIGFLTQSSRSTVALVENTQSYLKFLQETKYPEAYGFLSKASQKNYSEASFVGDHQRSQVRPEDCQINKVALNEFDSRKANVELACPLGIYGRNEFTLSWVKEGTDWHVVANRAMLFSSSEFVSGSRPEKKKKGGISGFFRKIF